MLARPLPLAPAANVNWIFYLPLKTLGAPCLTWLAGHLWTIHLTSSVAGSGNREACNLHLECLVCRVETNRAYGRKTKYTVKAWFLMMAFCMLVTGGRLRLREWLQANPVTLACDGTPAGPALDPDWIETLPIMTPEPQAEVRRVVCISNPAKTFLSEVPRQCGLERRT